MKNQERTTWSLFAYIAADDQVLSRYGQSNTEDLLSINSSEVLNITIELDQFSSRTGSIRLIKKATSEILKISGEERNSGSKETLQQFLLWSREQCESEKYLIIIGGHGSSFRRDVPRQPFKSITKDIAKDANGTSISIGDIRAIFTNIPRVNILCFDSCVMGFLEICAELSKVASYMIVSQHDIPAKGFPYKKILKETMFTDEEVICNSILKSYIEDEGHNKTLSCISTDATHNAMNLLGQLGSLLVAGIPHYNEKIQDIRRRCLSFDEGVDAISFLKLLKDECSELIIKEACQNAINAFTACIRCSVAQGQHSNATGLTIWFPRSSYLYERSKADYHQLQITHQFPGWKCFLHCYFAKKGQ
jgi:hypothetical protein